MAIETRSSLQAAGSFKLALLFVSAVTITNRTGLLLHLLLIFVVIVTLQSLLCELLGFFPDALGDLLMPALGGAIHVADPCHLQLKLLVLVVVVCNVDDARGLLDALLQ